jgi:hypothetical protein
MDIINAPCYLIISFVIIRSVRQQMPHVRFLFMGTILLTKGFKAKEQCYFREAYYFTAIVCDCDDSKDICFLEMFELKKTCVDVCGIFTRFLHLIREWMKCLEIHPFSPSDMIYYPGVVG